MPRYSSHEQTKYYTFNRSTERARGILARISAVVLETNTPRYDWTKKTYLDEQRIPVGKRVAIRVLHLPKVNKGVPLIEFNALREGMTLIERPRENRLRIVFPEVHGGWVEIALAPFHRMLKRAAAAYAGELPPFTTTALAVQIVRRPKAPAHPI